jgi:hypothetical protein
MKALAVVAALLVGFTSCLVGGAPASAGDVVGTKQFKKDCALEMRWRYENGSVTHFIASDSGSECADYFVRSVSLTTKSGYHEVRAISQWPDGNFDPYLEELNAYADSTFDPLVYGNANVFIPSLHRCDRYQLTMHGTVTYLDSRPCTGSHYPPGVKPFKQDCSLFMSAQSTRGGPFLSVFDLGSECGDYVLRGIGAVSTTGVHTSAGQSDGDLDEEDPDHEWIATEFSGELAYGTVNVYLPTLARCDRYLYGSDKRVRFLDSRPCTSTT